MMRTYGNELTNMVAGHHEAEVLMPAGVVRGFFGASTERVAGFKGGAGVDLAPPPVAHARTNASAWS